MPIVKASDIPLTTGRHPGVSSHVLLNADVGAGAVTLGELIVEPGGYLRPHIHLVEEAFFIFEGSGLALVGDQEIPVSAGTAILAPTGTAHGFRNNSDAPLKMAFFYPALNPIGIFPEQK